MLKMSIGELKPPEDLDQLSLRPPQWVSDHDSDNHNQDSDSKNHVGQTYLLPLDLLLVELLPRHPV